METSGVTLWQNKFSRTSNVAVTGNEKNHIRHTINKIHVISIYILYFGCALIRIEGGHVCTHNHMIHT